MSSDRPTFLITAVEASADLLGARLMNDLEERLGDRVRFIGVGGARMAKAGLASLFDPGEMAVIGAFNALAIYPLVRRRARQIAELAAREQPDAVILIDAWGFSLRVARGVRRLAPGLPIIKYVAPQVWATRPGRAKTLAQTVDHLLTLHAFDTPWFERVGLATTFVGNPALDRDFSRANGPAFRQKHRIAAETPILLILPGSRAGEIKRLLPPFADAAQRLKALVPEISVVVGAAQTVEADLRARIADWPFAATITSGDEDRLSAMKAATVALACSGTVTTELALAGCPFVVGYKVDSLTYEVAKRLIRTQWITLINVAAEKTLAPEFIQGNCTGANLAQALASLSQSTGARELQISEQHAALAKLSGSGQAENPADAVLRLL